MSYFWAALRYYAVFKGRTNVKSFWVYQLIVTIVTTVCWVIPLVYTLQQIPSMIQHINIDTNNTHLMLAQITSLSHSASIKPPFALQLINDLGTLFFLVTFIPTLAISARRLHDSNHSAALLWLMLVPLVGFIVVIIYLTLDSTPGDNRFGPNPKGAFAGTTIPQ
jgi:uncharacterized membrane protein YhaH (DUF805 family)